MDAKTKLSPTQNALNEIDTLIRARYPVLYLLTHEEARVEGMIQQIAQKQSKQFFTWTATQGLRRHEASDGSHSDQGCNDPLEDPQVVRKLRDLAHELKDTYKSILIVSPRLNLPVELEKDITLVDFPLPDVRELFESLKDICTTVAKKNPKSVNLNSEEATALARAAQGLTLTEAENAFAKSIVNDGVLNVNDVELVIKEKQQIIRKSGVLDFYPAEAGMNEIGGLYHLKRWLLIRGKAFSSKAAEFGLPAPKGVLLLGAPGCGKSLTAKAIANIWKLPLLRLDFGKIFSGLVGSSEENMRRALKVAEGVSPAILWIDEIEKGLAGGVSGTSDGGTGARVFGTFLTWMQEKTSTVFVVATANRIDALPPELLRRGRFDEIFFADLPEAKARAEVISIHVKKRKRAIENFDLNAVVAATSGFSGAEIENTIVEGLFNAYHEGRELTTDDILKAAKETVPLSVTYAEDLKRLRDWSKNRARPADLTEADLRTGAKP